MKVTIELSSGEDLAFEQGLLEAGPAGTFFKVVQEVQEETKAGLIVSVGAKRKHTWVPASTIRKAEVVE
jgi:hypothetical protein